jgi:hypothetical protein
MGDKERAGGFLKVIPTVTYHLTAYACLDGYGQNAQDTGIF